MSAIKATLNNTKMFIVMSVFLTLYAAAHLWPASFWFEVISVRAGPSKAGHVVPMLVDRTIHRPFLGEWTVSVKRFVSVGWVNHCTASGRAHYEKGAELPTDLDLNWWTNGACQTLPEGRYAIETTWHIQPTFAVLPERRVNAKSNIFEVSP